MHGTNDKIVYDNQNPCYYENELPGCVYVTGRYHLFLEQGSQSKQRPGSSHAGFKPSGRQKNVNREGVIASIGFSSHPFSFCLCGNCWSRLERPPPSPVGHRSAPTCLLVGCHFHACYSKAVLSPPRGLVRIHGAVAAGGWTTTDAGKVQYFWRQEDTKPSYGVSMWWALWWVDCRWTLPSTIHCVMKY